MAQGRDAFFGRVTSSLVVPMTLLPLAAALLAAGALIGAEALSAAGQSMVVTWVPLFYAIGISIGFTDADAMGTLSVTIGYLVMMTAAGVISGSVVTNPGVLGGLLAGVLCTWVYNHVKQTRLPEYLALFSGKRTGPYACALAGLLLGLGFGWLWPYVAAGIVALWRGLYAAGAPGAFVYGSLLRLLFPTGMHHLLMQVMDGVVGGWVEPTTGRLVAGEYLRFLAGDPAAGRILSGFFLTNAFSGAGAALALVHAARPGQRARTAAVLGGGVLAAATLGVTEIIDTAYMFASPVLYGLHVVLSGFASMVGWALNIRAGGYGLPMLLVNWHRSENAWLLLPLGLLFMAVYYFSFRAVIRWLRPAVLGQEADGATRAFRLGSEDDNTMAVLDALGGPGNITAMDACMTRLRFQVRDLAGVDDDRLLRLGASGVVRPGGESVQVVVGTRAAEVMERLRVLANPRPTAMADVSIPATNTLEIPSPLYGRVVPLDQVPDPVFAGGMAGEGVAIEPLEGLVVAPVFARVVHIFHGGHAIGLVTPEGVELLIHIGIDTVALKGEGFTVLVSEGEEVQPGRELVRFDQDRIAALGKPLVTPVLISNPGAQVRVVPLASAQVRAGSPLLTVRITI